MEKIEDVTGVLLAGGKSSRMGQDKAVLHVNGKPLYEGVLETLQSVFASVIIAGDRPSLAREGVPYFADTYPGSALGGLHTALSNAKTDKVFIAACDLPHADPNIIRLLLSYRHKHDVVVAKVPLGFEPLFAVYDKSGLPLIEDMLQRNSFKLYEFFSLVNVKYVGLDELPAYWQKAFLNINTPEDYAAITAESSDK